MEKYMLLEVQPLTQAEIDQALKRAHRMRSEAAWKFLFKCGAKLSRLVHSFATGRSELMHTS